MAQRRQEIEAFVQHLVVEAEAAEAAGMTWNVRLWGGRTEPNMKTDIRI